MEKKEIRKIGIALAAYKPEISFFVEQLKSIQSQSWQNWVCVITFDSPMAQVVEHSAIASFRSDLRFVWLENPKPLGHKKNFEKAIQAVLGHGVDAIACSDQDDLWYPEKLAACAARLEEAGPLSLVHSDMHVLLDGKTLPDTAWKIENRGIEQVKPEHFFIRNIVAGCSMLFDAELARRFPVIPEGAEFHDYWYALVASFFGGVHAIPRPLYAYRQHGSNVVGVSPFVGLFTLRTKLSPLGILEKCRKGYLKSRALAQSAKDGGLPLTKYQETMFLSRWDLGALIFAMGLRHIRKDPPLARACLARAAGKARFTAGFLRELS